MNKFVRNALAVLVGLVGGSIINMLIVNYGGVIIPTPEGFDFSTMEGLKEGMQQMQPKHFLMPFLAHALGTFVGASICVTIAKSSRRNLAMLIALGFFTGGFINVMMLPSPLWFSVVDLSLAYFPMAFLAWIFFGKKKSIKYHPWLKF